jgi:uncharacterized protein
MTFGEHEDINANLYNASFSGDIEGMLHYIRDGADINSISRYDLTPLMGSMENCEFDAMQLLLARDCNPNVVTQHHGTALHLAVDLSVDLANQRDERPSVDLIERLLRYGADPTVLDNEGRTPIDIAMILRHREAVRVMKDDVARRKAGSTCNPC